MGLESLTLTLLWQCWETDRVGPPLHLFLSALASAYPSASGLWLGLCLVLVHVEDFLIFLLFPPRVIFRSPLNFPSPAGFFGLGRWFGHGVVERDQRCHHVVSNKESPRVSGHSILSTPWSLYFRQSLKSMV